MKNCVLLFIEAKLLRGIKANIFVDGSHVIEIRKNLVHVFKNVIYKRKPKKIQTS